MNKSHSKQIYIQLFSTTVTVNLLEYLYMLVIALDNQNILTQPGPAILLICSLKKVNRLLRHMMSTTRKRSNDFVT